MAVVRKDVTHFSEAEKATILRQTEKLLESRHFSGSKRYPALLRYVVQQTLDGHQESLKERTLGIEVFDRDPHFDTAGDSIVRVTAAEVRKRIALYYQDEAHESELRIDLPSGSYVPQFRYTGPSSSVAEPEPKPAIPAPAEEPVRTPRKTPKLRLRILVILIVGLAATLGLAFWGYWDRSKDILSSFWQSKEPVMVCIGSPLLKVNQPGADDPAVAAALGTPTTNNTLVPLSDAITLGEVQALLMNHRKEYRVLLARRASLDDLRSGPVILIGALDNPWTIRITSKMRFQFRGNESTQGGIVDTKSQKASDWNVNFQTPYSDRTQDYAIVAFTHDDTTGEPVLIAAGAGPNGTRAAGEFLTNQVDLRSIMKMAPPGWHGENLEIVLATQVIQGNSGQPRILSAEFW